MVARRADGQTYRTRGGPGGAYRVEGLLPGEYLVFAFADLDGDGRQSPGRRSPWQAAEPYMRHPESVAVASGEVQDGIDLELK